MPSVHFEPAHYHRTFGSHESVLRLTSGATLHTTTVDAAGFDARDTRVTDRGNPLTGPFWIEGAKRGDTLVVRLDALRPNRRRGFSAALLAPGVVDPGYVPELRTEGERSLDWHVDADAGVARLAVDVPGLEGRAFATSPMLGCIGVAPDRGQAISTATSGEHGGNMDYRALRAGTTLHLPVFVDGALLFVGDAHALQGAGEMAGTGVEISCDVTLTVELAQGRTIGWPRGETEDEIFTIGNARPLDQATQHATTEMMRWLRADYGLSAVGASILIGQCADYDLGNMFDPAYTMVCRMRREDLPQRAQQT